MLKVLDLFSGIGGGALGLLAADLHNQFEIAQFVDCDRYCASILKRWFPTVPVHCGDIKDFDAHEGDYDIIFCSPPCQSHSLAGSQNGADDERNLWPDCYRLIKQVKPIGFVLENVPGIRHSNNGNFFRGILRDIANEGFSCEWDTITVKSLGGVHERERLFLIAWKEGRRQEADGRREEPKPSALCPVYDTLRELPSALDVAYTEGIGRSTVQPALSSQAGTDQTPITLASTTKPHWASTMLSFYGLDDGVPSVMAGCLMTPEQLPIAKTIATRKADKCEVAPGLQAVGNSISPQVSAIAWKKLHERITTIR